MGMRIVLFILLFFTHSCLADQLIVEPEKGREPILSFINHAKSSIELVMYGLTDNELIDALIHAKNNGKKVTILLESKPYRAEDENHFAMRELRANQLEINKANPDFKLLHQKTLLIDQQTAIVMTFNFTHSSFKNERNFALVVTDPAEVLEIQRVFNADSEHKAISVHHSHLVWSPNNSREKILELLQGAKTSIKIYAEGLSDYQTIGTLAKAARSGVSTQILMSDESNSSHSSRKFDYLTRAGVKMRFSKNYMIHAKVIIIDGKRAVLGSINLTKPSIDNNRELSVITEDPAVIGELNKTFNSDWMEANFSKKLIVKEVVTLLRKMISDIEFR